jgi:hypothetical protein
MTFFKGGQPTFVSVRRGVGAKGHMRLTARDEVEFPSFPSLRILKTFMSRRVAVFEGGAHGFSTEAREGRRTVTSRRQAHLQILTSRTCFQITIQRAMPDIDNLLFSHASIDGLLGKDRISTLRYEHTNSVEGGFFYLALGL